ncbi:MAG: tRNA (N6-isopentenyl adenosine(37)-C2)-methylthiotransferase MiaB [Pyrinomonadaceae bacterium]
MKKVYLETFGCQMNVSDSERVATQLESEGYEITDSEEAADVVLFNTCSVREKAEHKLFTRVGQIYHSDIPNRMVGVMGCVAQLEGETIFKKSNGIDFVLGTKAVGRIGSAIREVEVNGPGVIDLNDREPEYDWTTNSTQRHSPYVAFVPIIEGCNKFCTYCIVPFSRGREKSLPASEIVREVLKLRHEGVKEVHLIGQNVNSYRPKTESGLENIHGATLFSRLLRAVARTGIERIKFTTSFPRDFHTDIVDAIEEHENLCNWVHLPVQSGSDVVLKAMRRGHSVENYKKRIDRIHNSTREIALSTDVIVGFPGETRKDFEETLDLFEYCKFDSAYIFNYSSRPGTPASLLDDDVSKTEKTERFLELEALQRSIQTDKFFSQIGKTLKVLVEGTSKQNSNALSGHSTCHKVVNFLGEPNLLGSVVNIRITEAKRNSLYGEIEKSLAAEN